MSDYFPATQSQALSNALLELSRPPSVRLPGEVTTALCACEEDLMGDTWVIIDRNKMVYVHPKAELGNIGKILQPFIDAGALPTDTNQVLADYVIASRGQRIRLWDVIPQLFKNQSLTREQIIEEGKLNAPMTIS